MTNVKNNEETTKLNKVDDRTFLKLYNKYKDMPYNTKQFWYSSFKVWPSFIFIAIIMIFFNGSAPAQIVLVAYAVASIKISLDIYTFEEGLFERYKNGDPDIIKYINEYYDKYKKIYVNTK